ncbi:hypothetical protein SJ958_14515 [Enterococcus faecium]
MKKRLRKKMAKKNSSLDQAMKELMNYAKGERDGFLIHSYDENGEQKNDG